MKTKMGFIGMCVCVCVCVRVCVCVCACIGKCVVILIKVPAGNKWHTQTENKVTFPVVMYGCESWTVKKAEH